MSRKHSGLSWVKKQEPKFIREFKERIAYKEQSSIETKVFSTNLFFIFLIKLSAIEKKT